MVIMEPAPPRSLRPNQRRADSGSLSVTQGDTQTLTLLCMRAPFTPARSSAAAATSTGPARSVTVRDAQPPGPNDVEPAGRRPCRRVRRLVVAEQRSQLQPPDVVLSLLRVSWVQKCAPSSHSRGTTSPLPHHPVRHLLDPRALGLRPHTCPSAWELFCVLFPTPLTADRRSPLVPTMAAPRPRTCSRRRAPP
jgi:hypothetical protein